MNEHIDRRPAIIKAVNNYVNDMANRFKWASCVYSDWERRVREGNMPPFVTRLTPGFLRGGLRWAIFATRKFVEGEGLMLSMVATITGGRVKNTFKGRA